MRNVRISWIASAIVFAIALPVFAQSGGAQPAKEPAKPAPAPTKEPAKEPAKPAVEPAKPAAPVPTVAKEPAKEPAKPTAPAAAATAVAVGKPAPDFKLKGVDGKEHGLAEYKGKVVVLEWSNADCQFCQRHAKGGTVAKVMGNFKDKPVVWVNVDSTGDAKAEDCKKFATDNKVETYLLDPTGATGKAYGAKTTPHCFVIDKDGKLAYMGAIDDDKDGTKGDKAKNYVKEAIDAVLKGSTVATATTDPYGCPVKYKG
jgi:peroxiredoxin